MQRKDKSDHPGAETVIGEVDRKVRFERAEGEIRRHVHEGRRDQAPVPEEIPDAVTELLPCRFLPPVIPSRVLYGEAEEKCRDGSEKSGHVNRLVGEQTSPVHEIGDQRTSSDRSKGPTDECSRGINSEFLPFGFVIGLGNGSRSYGPQYRRGKAMKEPDRNKIPGIGNEDIQKRCSQKNAP